MNILMTADCLGGVWNYALELARGLQRYNCVIHLVVFGGPLSRSQREEAGALENVRCLESDLRLEWMDDAWDDVQAAAGLLEMFARKVEPELVHLNGYALAARVAWRAPVIIGAHSCVLSWWEAVKREPAPPWLDQYRQEVSAGLGSADAVVAPTAAMLSELRRIYNVDFSGAVIANGIDPSGFAIRDKVPQILSAGRLWDEAKNIALLDAIARDLKWPVLVAGEAACCGSERRFRNARTLGKLRPAALRAELSRTSIYAAPAWYEPFGLAVLEAALSGCALVLADIPSFRELWTGAAVLIDPSDVTKWKRELNRIISDAAARSALAQRAYRRGKDFNRDLMSDRYHTLYRELAARPREAAIEVVA